MSGIICIFNEKKDCSSLNKSLIMSETDIVTKFESENLTMSCVRPHYHKNFMTTHQYNYFNKNINIVYYGRIKRKQSLFNDLKDYDLDVNNLSDEEIIAFLYCHYSEKCLDYIEGSFVFVIKDENTIFAARDHLGILPLYYYTNDLGVLIICSKIKCILDYLGECIVDKDGIKELLSVGPSLSPGKTIYKNIYSLKPAHSLSLNNGKMNIQPYWILKKKKITDNYDEIIDHIKYLLYENTLFQYDHDSSACLLSGGIDSSIICAILNKYYKINTFSLSYEQQDMYFKSNEYQNTQDDYYIQIMNKSLKNIHTSLTINQNDLYKHLLDVVKARDMPGMSDIDSSFYLLLREIKNYPIVLSGECADEIFGGYPWFYKEELYNQKWFPWMRDIDKKIELLNDNVKNLNIKDYIIDSYESSKVNSLSVTKRTILLNYQWFMQTLLIRGECISNILNKEIRMPFASKDIIEYVFNINDEYFMKNNEEKSLLRDAFNDILPGEITHRKKNPYPKTYSPVYTELLVKELEVILSKEDTILYKLFNKDKLIELVKTKGESFQYPWYGQLMKGPQLLAYLIQIELWFREYNIKLEL